MEDFNVRFREMSDDEFDKFTEWNILDYSQDLIKSGLCSEENAFESAKKSFNGLIPQGKYTKDNFIYVVVNSDNEDVGFIWYQKYKEDIAFICDFLILEKFRNQGYGKQTLLLIEKEAKEKGLNKILLNVFKYNKPAFSLYKSLEYEIRDEEAENISMLKKI
ncbi:MAG: GNAT family N-acetyltransferase [Clostridium sp.]|uniref:GNAT family N-acetyltransferase n=1 Tax=Clostridium sp. TaxID=1506 RepID=UPI003D6CBF58